MLVERAEENPDLVRHDVDAGHEIGLHGIDHTALPLSGQPIEELLRKGKRRLGAVIGQEPTWFRPPFGSQTLNSYRATRRAGLDVVVWGPQGADWERPCPDEIAANIARSTRAGDIVLLHDGLSPQPPADPPVATLDRAAVLDRTISTLSAAGLGCTSLGALVRTGRARRSVWFRPPPG
jgi:peptidoglycan/xylan/chitin deacetylase (PgdA/CDA1 family)